MNEAVIAGDARWCTVEQVMDRVGLDQGWQIKVFLLALVVITVSHVFSFFLLTKLLLG